MPKHKIRQSTLAMGGFTSGGNFLFGSASMNSPSAVADSVVVGASIAVAGVGAGDTILATASSGMLTSMVLKAVKAEAGGISASFMNSASTDVSASSDVTINYIVFS